MPRGTQRLKQRGWLWGRRSPVGLASARRWRGGAHRPGNSRLKQSACRPLAVVIAAGLVLFLAPSCVVTARLHVVTTPNVTYDYFGFHGTYDEKLTAVAAVTHTDVWATGNVEQYTAKGGGAFIYQPLLLHWDGRGWRIATPTPPLGIAELSDVTAVARNDLWAAGWRLLDQRIEPLVLHFNGQRWAQAVMPRMPNWATLSGVAARSASDVWAVGALPVDGPPGMSGNVAPLTLHFDGTTWQQVPVPIPGAAALAKIAAAPAGAVYAAGGSWGDGVHPPHGRIVIRWDGHTWTSMPMTGIAADAELRDIAVIGSDVWAVGDRANAAGPIEAVAWRLNGDGKSWSSYRIDPHRGAVLNGVHTTSPTEVWAAGTPGNDGSTDGVLLTRWNGTGWHPAFRIPAVPALRGLADVTTAGGHVFSVGGASRTLAVQN
jgi:hypothetical protein